MARGFVGYQWSLNFLSVVRGRAKKGREDRGHAEEREKIVSLILYFDASTLIRSGWWFSCPLTYATLTSNSEENKRSLVL